jgi:hypothetical protein
MISLLMEGRRRREYKDTCGDDIQSSSRADEVRRVGQGRRGRDLNEI